MANLRLSSLFPKFREFDECGEIVQRLPEHGLLIALLYQTYVLAIKGDRSALFWFEEDHPTENTFTYTEVCDYLNIDTRLRSQLLDRIPLLKARNRQIMHLRTPANTKLPPSEPTNRYGKIRRVALK